MTADLPSNDGHIVSVVIPTLGRETLNQVRAALEAQTRRPDEIIVVVDRDRKGASWARNEGIRRAKGDLIAFSDDDGVPPQDWLQRLIAALDEYQADVSGGDYHETDPLLDEMRRLYPMPEITQLDTEGYAGNSGSVLFRRSCLQRCHEQTGHFFDETILTGEDWEFVWRLRQVGATVVFVPVKTLHLRKAGGWKLMVHKFNRGVGIATLYTLQRREGSGFAVQKSLLWGPDGALTAARWLKIAWVKAVGPFCRNKFSRSRYFWAYWCAEKAQGLGFLWKLLRG